MAYRNCICRNFSVPAMLLTFSIMLGFPRSSLIHISVTKRHELANVPKQCSDSISKIHLHDKSLRYDVQTCSTLVKPCHILLGHYPAMPLPGFTSPVTVLLALTCLFPARLLVCPRSASILATALPTSVLTRSCSSLAFDLTYSS